MNLQNFLRLIWPPAVVLGLHIVRVIAIPKADQFDILAHFLGGASITLVAWNIERLLIVKQRLQRPPVWLSWFLVIATAELVGVLWEFWEFFIQKRIQHLELTLEDTVLDLLLDLAGATVMASTLAWRKRHG